MLTRPSFIFSRFIVNPIKKIIETTQKIAKGDYKQRVKVSLKDKMGDLCQAINQMAEGLEKTEKMRKELIGNISHELATPLTNIGGYLEALKDGVIKGKAPTQKNLNLLKEETDRLTSMVEDVRALSAVEQANLVLYKQKLDIAKLIDDLVLQFNP